MAQESKQTAVSCTIATEQTSNVTAQTNSDLIELNQSMMELHQKQMQEVRELQLKDANSRAMMVYLEKEELPEDEKAAKKLILENKCFGMVEGVLHHEHPTDHAKWCMVVPMEEQPKLLEEHHGGRFAGHFAERKMYSTLRQQYWWKGMQADVRRHCRSYLTCVTRKGTGRPSRPPLKPIEVGGPFHRVGVDALGQTVAILVICLSCQCSRFY